MHSHRLDKDAISASASDIGYCITYWCIVKALTSSCGLAGWSRYLMVAYTPTSPFPTEEVMFLGRAMRKVSPGICAQRRPRSPCTSAQSDQGLHCPLTESLDTTESVNGENRPAFYCFALQANLEWYCSHLPQCHFSHGEAHVHVFGLLFPNWARCYSTFDTLF